MANPRFQTLSTDTDTTVTLDANYGQVEVTLVTNPATTYFNATGTAIGPVAGSMDGNHVLTATLIAKVVTDGTAGTNTVVHLRSAGTPTVQVLGL